ncbi:helix-turn-helix domain-containing protein [Paenibacillus sp. GSMTC-2017]|uniref:helix-turn-helix transcriptional regulator n=1 Tax=Paenibacillus sp. GSMTC-2017 TaxID=2794350 RepID=UPI0018D7AF74|nr:AraC family transcriptional regulator [Paenibacillus sp. GSMTC-2017]MBH5320227.1 helix-turn-helix domain-containing protein [Paenibacillus sp. GSMTC-2017]
MDTRDANFPRFRSALFREWSPSIHYAQFQRLPRGRLPERRIYDFELLYVSHGEAAITMFGERFSLTAGQLIFLPSGIYHQNEALSEPETRFLGIHFDFFDEVDIQTESDMVVNEGNVQHNRFGYEAVSDTFPPLSQHPVYTPSLMCVQLMEQLVHEFTMRPPGYELVCRAHMLNILAHLLRQSNARTPFLASQHDSKLIKLIEMIDKSPAEPWTNTLLAERMNLSIDHTAKLFKKLAGLPPNEYVHAARHREARRLLRETESSIECISEEIGYSGIHYFSRLFRKHEGISASEYRKLTKVL